MRLNWNTSRTTFTAFAIAALASACTPPARAPASRVAADAHATGAALDALVDKHFLVINEAEPTRRQSLMADAYTQDVGFFDPGKSSHGTTEVAAAFDHLHARFPGAVFTRDGALQDREGTVRVGWLLTQPGHGVIHRGEDIMRIDGNRIRSITVYVQPEPKMDTSGVAGIDHAGVTVPNLAAATTFFHDVLGCEKVTSMDSFKSNDDWFHTHLGVDARAELVGIAMMRCGFGSNLELLEYKDRTRREAQINNSDLGAAHLAFYTQDFAGALGRIKSHGVATMGEPTAKTSGETGGETFVYFRAPWGLQLELVSAPNGKAYEKERGGVRLWSPLNPAE